MPPGEERRRAAGAAGRKEVEMREADAEPD